MTSRSTPPPSSANGRSPKERSWRFPSGSSSARQAPEAGSSERWARRKPGTSLGAGLTIALQWIAKRRNPNPAPAPGPVDPLNPAPAPDAPKTPILDAILNLLKLKLLNKKDAPVQFQSLPVAPASTDVDLDDELMKKLLALLTDAKK